MDDQRDISETSRYLETAGLSVTRVEESPRPSIQRCDLSAADSGEQYLVEVKGLHDEEQITLALRKGQSFEIDRSHAYRKRVALEIHEATNQLRDTAIDFVDHVWLVCLIARSKYDAKFMSEQILGTLYGVGAITDYEIEVDRARRRCLYFSESAFHKHRELDGAIVLGPNGAALHLNDYGRRIHRIRQSGLAQFFALHNALYDMQVMEIHCDCFVADFDIDRSDRHAVLELLKEKYQKRKLQHIDWHRYEGIFAV